jgi:hypothetical protein
VVAVGGGVAAGLARVVEAVVGGQAGALPRRCERISVAISCGERAIVQMRTSSSRPSRRSAGAKGFTPRILRAIVGDRRVRCLEGERLGATWSKLHGKDADLEVQWIRGGRTLRMRLVLLWNPGKKRHILLLTSLGRDEVTPSEVASLYRLRWEVELVFKEWRSYANLHAFPTGKAAIAEGLIRASLCAATPRRAAQVSARQRAPGPAEARPLQRAPARRAGAGMS